MVCLWIILILILWAFLSSLVVQIIPKIDIDFDSDVDRDALQLLAGIFSPIAIVILIGYYLSLLFMSRTKGIVDAIMKKVDELK